jgi:hypothetical protein
VVDGFFAGEELEAAVEPKRILAGDDWEVVPVRERTGSVLGACQRILPSHFMVKAFGASFPGSGPK